MEDGVVNLSNAAERSSRATGRMQGRGRTRSSEQQSQWSAVTCMLTNVLERENSSRETPPADDIQDFQ